MQSALRVYLEISEGVDTVCAVVCVCVCVCVCLCVYCEQHFLFRSHLLSVARALSLSLFLSLLHCFLICITPPPSVHVPRILVLLLIRHNHADAVAA